jgi:hypothetical protein
LLHCSHLKNLTIVCHDLTIVNTSSHSTPLEPHHHLHCHGVTVVCLPHLTRSNHKRITK